VDAEEVARHPDIVELESHVSGCRATISLRVPQLEIALFADREDFGVGETQEQGVAGLARFAAGPHLARIVPRDIYMYIYELIRPTASKQAELETSNYVYDSDTRIQKRERDNSNDKNTPTNNILICMRGGEVQGAGLAGAAATRRSR
jgi:hypothetical protein